MKLMLCLGACLLMSGCLQPVKVDPVSEKTPGQVVSEAGETDWLDVNQDDLLYLQLTSGQVVMALAPDSTLWLYCPRWALVPERIGCTPIS